VTIADPHAPATAAGRPRVRASAEAPRRHRVLLALVVALLACASGAAWLYTTLPGVADAPRLAAARLGGAPATRAPLPHRIATAVVAVEDERYWHHGAVDPISLGRVAVDSVIHPGRDGGGSTLTQQLARVLYLHGGGGALDTLRAVELAFKLEHRYSKTRILAMYLDSVYFGHGYWGIGAASRGYFGVAPRRLTWGEASLLAGLPQAPTRDDPVRHFAVARARQREVLRQLVANHRLTPAQAAAAYRATPRPIRAA
jgi:membrane peptidoglycan carboxypeptidase